MEFLLIFNYFIFAGLYQIQNINFTALAILVITNTVGLIFYYLNKKNNQYKSNLKKNNPNHADVSLKFYLYKYLQNYLIN